MSTRIAALFLVVLVSPSACNEVPRAGQAPDVAEPGIVAGPEIAAAPAEEPAFEPLYGRWAGPQTCLELDPTGEFRLTGKGKGPKVVISGEVSQRAAGAAQRALALRVQRIDQHRWVGPCRKRVVPARRLDSHDALGVELTVGRESHLRIQRVEESTIELCGERCEMLTSEPPQLLGSWAHPAGETAAPGTPLRLEVRERSTLLAIAGGAGVVHRVHAESETTPVNAGAFTIRLAAPPPGLRGNGGQEGAPVALLGTMLAPDRPVELRVTRIVGGVEVCADACAHLLIEHAL